ncbi:MAG TPA: tetratricopeptide repeat protein [Kofleriaceae bacterium]|nr:tetratricopeptide repeat protein [Kofleriaceae bacterium]
MRELSMTRYLLAVALVAASTTIASAQGSSGAQAEVMFREGRDLMAKGKYPEACAAFEKSQQLDPAVTTLLNLAGCREKNGQIATAWGLFLDAERQTRGATGANTKLHDVAKERAANLEQNVSKLTINVKTNMQGLEVLRGTERIDSVMWGRALPVDGGTYTISAKAPGGTPWSTQVSVGTARDNKVVDVPDLKTVKTEPSKPDKTPPKATPSEEPEDEQPQGSGGAPLIPIAVGGGGLALIGGAVGFELWARSTYDDAKAETMDQSKRDELEDSANTRRHIGQAFAVAGVACVGVAVWLYVRKDARPGSETAHHQVVISPNGLALVGSF